MPAVAVGSIHVRDQTKAGQQVSTTGDVETHLLDRGRVVTLEIVASALWVLVTRDLSLALAAPWRASSVIVPAADAVAPTTDRIVTGSP